MAGITTSLKAEGVALALSQVLGSRPLINYLQDGTAQIIFTESQAQQIRGMMTNFIKPSGKKDDLDIQFLPVVLPLVLQIGIPVMACLVAIGYFIGKR